MSEAGSTRDHRHRPMSTLGFMGYALLFSIPVLGLIPLIIFSLDRSHVNRCHFARAWLCYVLIGLMLLGILTGLLLQALRVQGARLSAFLITVKDELQAFAQNLYQSFRDGSLMQPSLTLAPQLP